MNLSLRRVRIAGFTAVSGLLFAVLISNSKEPAPTGYTGSPSDGKTCGTNRGCHSGSSLAVDPGLISTDIPVEGYTPGKEYNITVTVTETGKSKFGFSFSPQEQDGTIQGSLIAGAGTKIGDTKYMSHLGGTTTGTGGMKAWPFKWKAPVAGSGTVNFYAVGNAADGRGTTAGDKIYTDSKAFIENENPTDTSNNGGGGGGQVSVNLYESPETFRVYPNPAQNKVWLESERNETVKMVNLKGQLVKTISISEGKNEIDITELDYGVYRIVNTSGSVNQTLVKL